MAQSNDEERKASEAVVKVLSRLLADATRRNDPMARARSNLRISLSKMGLTGEPAGANVRGIAKELMDTAEEPSSHIESTGTSKTGSGPLNLTGISLDTQMRPRGH